ncbi:Cytochrome P450 [Macleaya cordata]|uniref:Cytochrome P450 n=1 Tax=Macleaya cordata TaxID=56857 RepID=A0A200RBR9_MACCD|nr:Cytochrome P450 [Macleaya cordata]
MELDQFYSFSLLLAFLLLLFMVIKKGKRSKTKNPCSKLPPGPWKLPLIGNLQQLLGLPHHTLRDLAKKHGPLMHLQLGEVSTMVVSSPNVAKQIMKTHDLKFADRGETLAAKIMTYSCTDVAFSPYGDYWRQLRKIFLLELLSTKRVHSFRSIREEEVSNLIQNISMMAGSQINLSDKIFSLTNDITSRAAFGKKSKDKEAFISSIQEATKMASGFSIGDLFPSLKFLHVISGMKPKLEMIHQKVDKILDNIIKEHRNNSTAINTNMGELEEDLVDVLLRVKESGELEFPITHNNLKAVILDIFTAGTATSSTTVEWAMSELLKNPRVMKKVQAEVRKVNRNRTVDESEIQELNFLKLVIKETLRLHPALPLILPRQCRESCEIDGYEIPKKTKVIINAWAMGRDPEHWSDAESFDPERFNGCSLDYKGTNFEYIPFGAGRRMCPGMAFVAKQIMKTHDLIFADRGDSLAAKIMTYNYTDVGFSPYGDYWRQLRKIFMLELLSTKRVQSFRSLREEEVSNVIQSISLMAGSQMNLSDRIYSLTNDVTSRAAFGKKCKDKEAFISSMKEATRMASGFDVGDLFPSLKFLPVISGMRPKLERLHQKVDRILDSILKDHRENRMVIKTDMGELEEDLVDVLLRLQEGGGLEFPITIDNIKAVIFDIFTGGVDTTSTTAEWAISEMLKNPRVMEKAQAEVRQVLNRNKKVDESEIHELKYLKLVIKETLRLHPPVPPLVPLECRESCEIDGYEISMKTKVMVNVWAIGRDPEYWSDAESFEPERFNGGSMDYKGTNFEYIPFGAGRRMCPGITFGIANVELLLAQLLYHFDWKLPNGVKPEDLDMTETFGVTLRRKNDLHLIPISYNPLPVDLPPLIVHGGSINYKGTNFEYIPFGDGRRICPGITFAIANVELLLAQLLFQFDWKLPNGIKPEDLDMTESFGVTLRRRNDLHLIPIPYSTHPTG